jgi:hypothetical protein
MGMRLQVADFGLSKLMQDFQTLTGGLGTYVSEADLLALVERRRKGNTVLLQVCVLHFLRKISTVKSIIVCLLHQRRHDNDVSAPLSGINGWRQKCLQTLGIQRRPTCTASELFCGSVQHGKFHTPVLWACQLQSLS